MQQEKLEKEEEIIEMKLNLATQELDMMEQEIKYVTCIIIMFICI